MNELIGILTESISNPFFRLILVIGIVIFFGDRIIKMAAKDTGAITISLQKIVFNIIGVIITIIMIYIYNCEIINLTPALIKMGVPNPMGTLYGVFSIIVCVNLAASYIITKVVADGIITKGEIISIVSLLGSILMMQGFVLFHFGYTGFISIYHLERELGLITQEEYRKHIIHGWFQLKTNGGLAIGEFLLTLMGGLLDIYRVSSLASITTSTLPGAGTVPTTPAFAGTGTFSAIPKLGS
jgi:hypothetical protein